MPRHADGTKADEADLAPLQFVTHPQIVGGCALDPFAVLCPLDGGNGVSELHDDKPDDKLRDGLIVAAGSAEHGHAVRRAGVGVDIGGCCAAVADEAELAVAVQNLFGHAVKLGYKSAPVQRA